MSRAARTALALNAVAAVNAANAWHPFDRRGRGTVASFLAGLPTSELAVPYLGAHLTITAALARRGAFGGRVGAVNAALAAGTAAGYVAMSRAARTAGPVYERALREALGDDYRSRVLLPGFPGPDAAVARTPGLVRMARIRRRFALDADLSYGPAGRSNLLDIWHRADLPRDGRAPVLIQMPGGAWIMGNKQGQAYPLMSHLAERGWICVAISYRLGPRNTWPAQIVDVKRAIAWVREHIAGYGGDPDFLALTGGSAGGHLSSLAALTPNDPAWQPGFESADTSVAAAVPFYGAYDWTDRERVGNPGLVELLEHRVVKQRLRDAPDVFDTASPLSRITSDAPPFFLSHGTNDSLIPIEEGRLFAERLRAVSRNPVGFAELPRAQHAFDAFGSPRATAAAEAVARFLGVVYGDHVRGGRA
ncbi:alpha/beta hydrolase [Jatrophihabitans endophyticus]|uniref:alpha/beta hydrolase n=1 Tax=Jatrophihabitans endophyticus TaxID=1206085 RepID=UPI0019DF27A6|nr:alpha/beta hydrolase [Jatrophihabitans endophyticus]MBE7188672.1 alpha/beta hydrolase [Jatrophihabitans endophyticus]